MTKTMLVNDSRAVAGSQIAAVECHNLVPADAAGLALIPVGAPARVAVAGWRPLCAATIGDRRVTILCSGSRLGYTVPGEVSPTVVCTLPSTPVCAVASAGKVTVMTADGPYMLVESAGVLEVAGYVADLPTVMFEAVEAATFSETAAPLTLSQSYSSGATVAETDRRAIARALADVARRMNDNAVRAGAMLAPTIARCRFLDADGNTVHKTPPVLAGIGPTPIDSYINLYTIGTDGVTLTPQTVEATAWRLQVTIDGTLPGAWASVVRAVAVDICQPFADTDPGISRAVARVTGRNSLTVNAALNAINTLSADIPDESRRRVLGAMTAAEGAFVEVHRFTAPIVSGTSTVLTCSPLTAGTPVAALPAEGVPHTFVAEGCAVNGTTVAWRGARRRRWSGYDLRHFGAQFADKAWRAVVTVTFADGERVEWSGSGSTGAPTAFSPMLCYPDADAVSMRVSVLVDGSSPRSHTVALSPCGTYAASVDSTFAPIAFSTQESSIVGEGEARVTHPRRLVIADTSTPFAALSAFSLGDGITAIATATSTGGAWEFGRSRFYVFSPRVTRLVTVSADRASVSANPICNLGASDAARVASGPCGTYLLTDTGEILSLSGTKVQSIGNAAGASAIGYDTARASVMAYRPDDGRAECLDTSRAMARYTMSVPAGEWVNADDISWVVDAQGVWNPAERTADVAAEVSWRGKFATLGKALHDVTFNVSTSDMAGRLSVERAWQGNESCPVAGYDVAGRLAAPLKLGHWGRHAQAYFVSIEGTVAPDTIINIPSINLTIRRQ